MEINLAALSLVALQPQPKSNSGPWNWEAAYELPVEFAPLVRRIFRGLKTLAAGFATTLALIGKPMPRAIQP